MFVLCLFALLCVCVYLRAAPTAADPSLWSRSFVVLRLGDGEAWKLGGSADLRFGCLEPRRLGGLGGLKLLKLLSPLGWCLLLGCSCGLLGASWELLGVPGLEASEALVTSCGVSGALVVLLVLFGCS